MKRHFTINLIGMMTAILFMVVFMLNGLVLTAQTFKLSGVSDMVRVFEDGYKLPPVYDTIKIFGIRGEIISGQFVINAKKNLTDVTVELTALRNATAGVNLPINAVEWNFVGSVPLTKNTPNQPPSALVRQAPARFPEYLMAEKQLSVKAKTWQSVWLTVNIPEDAGEGKYLGVVTVKCGPEKQSLPVIVTVYPLTLPEERHLKIVEWFSTGSFKQHYNIQEEYSPEWFAMLRKYADNMVAHRQNTFRVPMGSIAITKSKDSKFNFDFSRFDQIAQVFWSTGKMDILETGFLTTFGKEEWASTEIRLADINVKNPESGEIVAMPGEEVIPYLLPALENHLRQKGWLSRTMFHVKDEPSLHNALAWREVSAYLHKYVPDIRRIDAIETTFLLDEIEIAVPKLDHFATWNESYKKWQQKGNEVWFYTVGIYQGSLLPNKTIDVPLMDCRLMHWLNYKYDAVGYLHWGWNRWEGNPFEDVGMHIGDAWHVYPSKDGVLNSLRWEEMRNGIQDYEYFWMLENKIQTLKDSLGTRFSWINPRQRGKEIAGQVIQSFADRTNDPRVVNNAKMQIIKELLDFNTSPRIYVQTNPVENSGMTTNSSVEVFGWTEPGTKIIVNGKELPVSKQGLFLELFQLSTDDNTIRVEATGSKGAKEIVRKYSVR